MIKLENVTFYYNDAKEPALNDISFKIRDGEFVLITGPSGGGKSTLCRLFNGLIPHFYGGKIAGRIEVQDLDVLAHPPSELALKTGMVFQDPENQIVSTDVEREIAFGLENLGYPADMIARRLEDALDTIGISGLRHRPMGELSGGEKQKVVIAAVLALHPEVLVLDEPTSELDPQSAEEVLSVVHRLNDELGITVLLVEHRLDRVLHHTDRIIVIDKGKIIADGPPRDVFNAHYDRLVEIGTGIPPVIRLARELAGHGNGHVNVPLTVKEGRIMLAELLSGGHFRTVHRPEKRGGKPVIEVEKLTYAYADGRAVLRDVNFQVNEGEFITLMGRNGSGKTTLVKHLNGLLKPKKGRVLVCGNDTGKTDMIDLIRDVGMVFQNPDDHLFSDSVEEEIGFTLSNLGFGRSEISDRVNKTLEKFRLTGCRNEYPRNLSGGEKQRVVLASVIAYEPKILVLDEPTRGLDYRTKCELMAFLREYAERGNAVILVTHDVETAAEYADRVILLAGGEIIADGDSHDVLSRGLLFSPQINRLIQPFAKYGLAPDILTVEELLGARR